MQFVYPSFLWAMLALSIPIFIHLFQFRRTRKVLFTNVHLLREVKTETNRLRQIKNLLILLARLGMVAFLVLAFAQPFLPSPNAKNIKNANGLVSIYLDNSYSMQNEVGNDKYLTLAVNTANDLLKVYPKSAQFQLLTNNFENKEQYPSTAQAVSDRLTEIDFSPEYRSLPTVHKRQVSLLERFAPNRKHQIFWFSDFQKATSGSLDQLQLDTVNQYYLVPIRAEKTPNVRIDSVWLENPFIKSNESNQINVRLKSFSLDAYPNLMLKLFLDDKQVSTTSVKIAPNGSASTQFSFTTDGGGMKQARIGFEDYPVTFDNDYYFVLNASPTIQIVHLTDNAPSRYIPNVYSNEGVFKMQSFSVKNLDYNRLKTAELIILDGVQNADGELAKIIQERVRKGGSVVIFPPAEGVQGLNGLLNSLSVTGVQPQKNDSLGRGRANELALIESQSPFFRGMFERVPSNMNMPYSNPVLRWADTGENLLKFKNNRPFLSRFAVGAGKVFLCASPLNVTHTGFPKHALFVPVMYKIAALSKTGEDRLAYNFQEKTFKLRLKEPSKNQVYKLVKDKIEIVPAQRIVGDELVFEMPEQTLTAGFYKLMLDKKQEGVLAFNYDKTESEMDFYTAQTLQNKFAKQKNVQIYDIQKNKNLVQDFRDRNLQVNLWKYMLVGALVCLLLETAFVRLL
jgi:hypothetical protein